MAKVRQNKQGSRVKKNQLAAQLILVYFINLYMFRGYLGPSSGGTTVRIQQLVLIIPFRLISVVELEIY